MDKSTKVDMQVEDAQAKPKRGRSPSNKDLEYPLLLQFIGDRDKYMQFIVSFMKLTKRKRLRWYWCTYHVYKSLKPKVLQRCCRLSNLTDSLRKRLKMERIDVFETTDELLEEVWCDKRHCFIREVQTLCRRTDRTSLITPVILVTKEYNEDGLPHFHTLLGVPIPDEGLPCEVPKIRNYRVWSIDIDKPTFALFKYMCKYSPNQKHVDYFVQL